jgi:hypothetical protein
LVAPAFSSKGLRFIPDIHLEGLKKIMENLSKNNCSKWDLNNETEVLMAWPLCLFFLQVSNTFLFHLTVSFAVIYFMKCHLLATTLQKLIQAETEYIFWFTKANFYFVNWGFYFWLLKPNHCLILCYELWNWLAIS